VTNRFSALLRQLRLRANMTQEQLEEHSGVSVRTIRRFETAAHANPGVSTVRRLADALRLSQEERDSLLAASIGSPASAAPVPRQLPASPGEFVGRQEELAALDRAVGAVSAASGGGGVGKTWTVLHWAHRNLHRFPDGQLFVDLRGFDPAGRPARPAEVVRGFLDALGVEPAAVPAGEDAQTALYRTLLADKRMLVVLDNARDSAQVVPLLPGSRGCTVLVTSRDRLAGLVAAHGAVPLPLGVLDDGEAWDVLSRRLGARLDAESTADLLSYCAGLPLALAVVAARAVLRPDVSLATLAAELRDVSTRLNALDTGDPAASVHTVLSWTCGALDDEQAAALALLGLNPGPDISVPAAAALVGAPGVSTALRALERVSVIEQHAPGRYRMHDLVKLFALDQAGHLPPGTQDAARRRLVEFYLHTAHAADVVLEPHRPPIELRTPPCTLPDPMTWFAAEHANLLAAQRLSAARHWHEATWQLAWSMNTFHSRRGLAHDRLTTWQTALEATATLPAARLRVLRLLGYACAGLGRHEEATTHLHEAVSLAESRNDLTEQGRVHQTLARAWELRGDQRRSYDHAVEALRVFRLLDRPVWIAEALNAAGWSAAVLGDHGTAREHCEAALALHREHDNPDGEADTLDSLGYLSHRTGDHDQAVDHYQRALTLFRHLDYTFEAAGTLERLGHPHLALGQHDQARAVWQEALVIYRSQQRTAEAQRVQAALDSVPSRS
jgi:tetratricopeptide (TPR) repeat protein/transcriptional regulator with XRE-family HTH domain